MRRSAILGLAAAAVMAVSGVAALADGPGLRWELGFKHETPTWVKIQVEKAKTRVAWYMTYQVENATGATRKPAIRAVLLADTVRNNEFKDTCDAGTVKAVKEATGVKEYSTAIDLRAGIDDGKKVACVATFGAVNDEAKKIELRVYGLMDPVNQVNGKEVYEVKYWSAKYERKGDEFQRTEDKWKLVSSGWVVEESK